MDDSSPTKLTCSLGHASEYSTIDDKQVIGGLEQCKLPGCAGLVAWKRRGNRLKKTRHGVVIQKA